MLSIIVPVKNQEKYLRKCMNSIIGQTYSDIEVIVVVDSSTDCSLELCREYEKKDKRVKVIKVEFNDISRTRNVGLENVTGEIIGFVDPDDWIEPDTFAYMVNLKKRTHASIVCCGKQEVIGEEPLIRPNNEVITEFDSKAAIGLLVQENELRSHLWNKIYDRNLFQNIFFEEGRIYEDLMVMHQLFMKANKIVVSNQIFYHYRQHPESALARTNLRKKLDACHAADSRLEVVSTKFPELREILLKQYKYQLLALLSELKKADKEDLKTYWNDIVAERERCRQLVIPMNGWSEKLFEFNLLMYIIFIRIKRG